MWKAKDEGAYFEKDGKVLGIIEDMEDRWRWEIDQPIHDNDGWWGFADSLEEAQKKAEERLEEYGLV